MARNDQLPAAVSTDRYRPNWASTLALCVTCFLIVMLPSGTTYEILNEAAIVFGIGLIVVLLMEIRQGVVNILRMDLVMIFAVFGLTLLEYLPENLSINRELGSIWAAKSVEAIAVGIAGIAIGRMAAFKGNFFRRLYGITITPPILFHGLLIATVVGYLHQWIAVGFNPVEWISEMMGPRFSRPWGRGQFGDIRALMVELGLLIHLIPPVVGIILAKKRNFTAGQLSTAILILFITLFSGFTDGTRTIFIVYLVSFVTSYLIIKEDLSIRKFVVIISATFILVISASQLMIDFRRIGFENYLQGDRELAASIFGEQLFIDNNILTLGRIIQYFSVSENYLGLEVPFWALVKPIPRAIWSGKPKGLSIQIEDVRKEEGASATWAATFIGESLHGLRADCRVCGRIGFRTLCRLVEHLAFAVSAGSIPAAVCHRLVCRPDLHEKPVLVHDGDPAECCALCLCGLRPTRSVKLAEFDNSGFERGRSGIAELAWMLVSALFVKSWIPGSGIRVFLLRLFGATIGTGVVIKPGVQVKFPWKLSIGSNTWIGEKVWIDNIGPVSIGSNCCVSQRSLLCSGSHDWTKDSFDLVVGPINVEDDVWIAADAIISAGITVGKKSVIACGSVVTENTEEGYIYQGNPAVRKRRRRNSSELPN